VLFIGIPIRVSGWISIPVSASTTKHGQSFVVGSSQGVWHATNCVSKSVFRDYIANKRIKEKGAQRIVGAIELAKKPL